MGSRRPALFATALLTATTLLAGCGDDGGGEDDATDDRDGDPATATATATATTTTTTTEAGAAALAAPTCEDGTFDERAYILCTAGSGDEQPLVLALHGRGSSPEEMQTMTGLDQLAATTEGAAVVYPAGVDQGWGDDTFTTPDRPAGDEDVVFLDGLVAELQADPRIADGPVGVVGFSNGASMALRYGSARPEAVTGIVAVAGQLPRDPAIRPTAPVPLLLVYGTADPVRSYDDGIPDDPARRPGDPTPTLPTIDAITAFVDVAPGAAADHTGPEESDPDPADATRLRTEVWTGDDGTPIVLHAIVGGGHTWPGATGPGRPDFGAVSTDLAASEVGLAFLLGSGAE